MPPSRSVPLQAYSMTKQDIIRDETVKKSQREFSAGWKQTGKKTKCDNTWMKKSLGFPTSDLQRSPRKSDVRYFSSMEPSVPKNTPSSPWLNRTQTNVALLLWSSFDAGKKEKCIDFTFIPNYINQVNRVNIWSLSIIFVCCLNSTSNLPEIKTCFICSTDWSL